jgi:DNA-binding transcriptional ArsR family regulator
MRNRSVTYSTEATFQVLADPTRRAVLDLLRNGIQPAGEIARVFPVSRPAISKHLRLLRRAHLVQERREGRHRLYQLKTSLVNLKTFVEAEYAKETARERAKHK